MRKGTLSFTQAVTLALTAGLAGCQFAPPEAKECDCAEDVASADEAPEAAPTQSIFGPEAQLPEPEPSEVEQSEPLTLTIGFPDGGADLDANAVAGLETALKSPAMMGGAPITLGGHSDAGGNDKANVDASEARGLAVAAWLINRGVDESRISVIAFGEQNPIEPNAKADGAPNEAGRAANRRVEMEIGVFAAPEPDLPSSEAGD